MYQEAQFHLHGLGQSILLAHGAFAQVLPESIQFLLQVFDVLGLINQRVDKLLAAGVENIKTALMRSKLALKCLQNEIGRWE